ncbi:MAG: lipocalin-like domain-containing protein [Nitrososphaerales archaeon]
MGDAIARRFVGTWRLISYCAVTPDGATTYPFGPHPQGRLIYEANGRMAVQLGQPGQPPFASGDSRVPTDAEAREAYRRYLAYFGTYGVHEDQGIVVHHLEASLVPDWTGRDQVRQFALEGDRLTLTTPPTLFGGIARVATLVWERLP